MTERTINAERVEQLIDVFGSFDENVRRIEDAFGVKIEEEKAQSLKTIGDIVKAIEEKVAAKK